VPDIISRYDDRHAGSHGTFAGPERTVATNQSGVSDCHPRDVRDRVVRTGLISPDDDAYIASAEPRFLRLRTAGE
jgi:hypothetical protein